MLLKSVIKNLLLELCKVNGTNSVQIYTSVSPLEQQGLNTRTGPQEGTGGIQSLCGNRGTGLLLFPEPMDQGVSVESGISTLQWDCSLLRPADLPLLGPAGEGGFQAVLLSKPFPSKQQETCKSAIVGNNDRVAGFKLRLNMNAKYSKRISIRV